MKKVLRLQETLVYYDGIQLFVGLDQLESSYICLLVEVATQDTFLCCPVSPGRFKAFVSGEIDLLTIYTAPEAGELFTLKTDDYTVHEFEISTLALNDVNPEWLPLPGFFYKANKSKELIVTESKLKNRALFHLSIKAPESLQEHQLGSYKLAEILMLVQRLVKQSFSRSVNITDKDNQSYLEREKQPNLNVYAFAPGSFSIYFQSESYGDLLGDMEISKALARIDTITASLTDSEKALAVIKENRGHLARTYTKLLEYIVREKAAISYTWTVPSYQNAISHDISTNTASICYNLFTQLKDLSTVTKLITGRFTKIDTDHNKWAVHSQMDDRRYYGEATGHMLSGKIADTQLYRLTCEEYVKEKTSTGEEQYELMLVDCEPII